MNEPTPRTRPRVALIAAVARNGVIGRDGDLPWRLPDDLAHFKRLTLGHPIIMGRRTFESIGRPLPGRRSIVVTRQAGWTPPPGVDRAASPEQAIELAGGLLPALGLDPVTDEVFVIGGGELYAATLPLASTLYITHVNAEVDGDVRFPAIDPRSWVSIRTQTRPADDRHAYARTFQTLTRR